jgi:hypothetical protein
MDTIWTFVNHSDNKGKVLTHCIKAPEDSEDINGVFYQMEFKRRSNHRRDNKNASYFSNLLKKSAGLNSQVKNSRGIIGANG